MEQVVRETEDGRWEQEVMEDRWKDGVMMVVGYGIRNTESKR